MTDTDTVASHLTLSLKCPSYPDKLFSLQVPRNATIQNIKWAIQREHFQQASVDSMRLIFAGKILKQDVILQDILDKVRLS